MLILRTLLIWSAVYFSNPFNIPRLWYLVGTRSILVGWALLLDHGGIFIGCEHLVEFWTYRVYIIFIYALYRVLEGTKTMFDKKLVLQVLLMLSFVYFCNPFKIPRFWYLTGVSFIMLGCWLILDYGGVFADFWIDPAFLVVFAWALIQGLRRTK